MTSFFICTIKCTFFSFPIILKQSIFLLLDLLMRCGKNLCYLNLNGTNVSSFGNEAIVLPGLSELHLSQCNYLTDKGVLLKQSLSIIKVCMSNRTYVSTSRSTLFVDLFMLKLCHPCLFVTGN